MTTKIEWADDVWNPVTGCERVSPGCDHCYAATWSRRQMGEWKGRAFEDVRCHSERLSIPTSRRKPTRYFVNSMADLFHHDVPDIFIEYVFLTMLQASQHTFLILTKRPERMRRFVAYFLRFYRMPANVWLGVSIESNPYKWRANMLREIGWPNAFISFEPLLGAIDEVDLTGIRWAIFGGESGPGARLCEPRWMADGIRRAVEIGAAPFVKQLGTEWSKCLGDRAHRFDHKGGDIGRFPEYLRFREFPKTAVPA